MKRSLAILLTLVTVNAYCQNFQKEIDNRVWKPFIASFNALDTDAFMALHSKDLIRSLGDSKVILGWNEYFKNQQESDKRAKESGAKRVIEIRFIERISNSSQAVDLGIYKATVSTNDGKSAAYSYYVRFHVVMRKESGTWKILVDTDSSKGTGGEPEFKNASPLQ